MASEKNVVREGGLWPCENVNVGLSGININKVVAQFIRSSLLSWGSEQILIFLTRENGCRTP